MHVITNTDELASLCRRLASTPFITVDTEFMRERTYYAQLCLVQVASEADAALIDPLSDDLDLTPLLEVFANESVLKVFHAARQDIEIFYRLMNAVPTPLFDTQVAAMALGYGEQVGYEALIKAVTGNQIDKGSRFTDWSKRPLTDKQKAYALGDVTHLVDAYLCLEANLETKSRESWVEEEMQALYDPRLYHTPPAAAWERLKVRGNIKPRESVLLQNIAAWREREAQERDLPRSRILKDEAIPELARSAPRDEAAMGKLRAVPAGFERSKFAKGLLEAIAQGLSVPEDQLPDVDRPKQRPPAPPDVLDLLRVLLKTTAEAIGVAPRLIASAADLELIAAGDGAQTKAFTGWRQEVFGDVAVKLMRGEISLGICGKRVEIRDQDWTPTLAK